MVLGFGQENDRSKRHKLELVLEPADLFCCRGHRAGKSYVVIVLRWSCRSLG
ncbi:hypothetical protein HanHA300_Chr09g0311151 [Helianthus annuus]|nr:hypothetical protein HanHA300_Chr09g0311151 [Helianthus annuus]